MNAKPNALVTGAAGFIGTHLVRRLKAEGWGVAGIDTVKPEQPIQGVPFYHGTVAEAAGGRGHFWLREVLTGEDSGFDYIFHLAARIGVGRILDDPLAMLEEHACDSLAIARYAAEQDAKLIMVSSSEVYRTGTNLREEDILRIDASTIARAGYAVTKLYGEHVALAYHRQRNLEVVIPRLFNIAGPGQRAEGGCVMPIFCRAALTGEPLRIHGTGGQQRAFTHVSDCVDALIRLAQEPKANGQIVNIGCNDLRSMHAVATSIVDHARLTYQCAPQIHFVPMETLDPHAGVPSMQVRGGNFDKLTHLTGLTIPSRFDEIVSDVCAEWASRRNVEKRTAA